MFHKSPFSHFSLSQNELDLDAHSEHSLAGLDDRGSVLHYTDALSVDPAMLRRDSAAAASTNERLIQAIESLRDTIQNAGVAASSAAPAKIGQQRKYRKKMAYNENALMQQAKAVSGATTQHNLEKMMEKIKRKNEKVLRVDSVGR